MNTLISLDKLQMDTTAKIDTLNCNTPIRRRLLDLGFVPETNITPILKSASGDPTAFEVRGTIIALRKEDACGIWVKVLES